MTGRTTRRRRGDDPGTSSRLRPPPPACPHRARQRRHQRRGDQRLRHRPRAGVDRTFLYRHRDLLEAIHAAEAEPARRPDVGPAVTRASLQADLLAAHERCARLAARIQQLEHDYPNCSANTPGANPDSAHPPTSTQLQQRSYRSNSKSSTSGYNLKNETRTSPPPAPRTATDGPAQPRDATQLTHPSAARAQHLLHATRR